MGRSPHRGLSSAPGQLRHLVWCQHSNARSPSRLRAGYEFCTGLTRCDALPARRILSSTLVRSTRNAVPRRSSSAGNTRCEVRRISSSPEVALNQKVKQLIQKLGEAIHETVSESEDIAIVVKDIREQGFDVLLMLEATIGLNELETPPEQTEDAGEEAGGPFTSSDVTFLKSLRISVNENEAPADADEASGNA